MAPGLLPGMGGGGLFPQPVEGLSVMRRLRIYGYFPWYAQEELARLAEVDQAVGFFLGNNFGSRVRPAQPQARGGPPSQGAETDRSAAAPSAPARPNLSENPATPSPRGGALCCWVRLQGRALRAHDA